MKRLNYHHLLYFWTVVRTGSASAASKELKVSQPTVSEQIHALEKSLGRKLFVRAGRNLQPTDAGRLVYRYAEKIFKTGRELTAALRKLSAKPKSVSRATRLSAKSAAVRSRRRG